MNTNGMRTFQWGICPECNMPGKLYPHGKGWECKRGHVLASDEIRFCDDPTITAKRKNGLPVLQHQQAVQSHGLYNIESTIAPTSITNKSLNDSLLRLLIASENIYQSMIDNNKYDTSDQCFEEFEAALADIDDEQRAFIGMEV